MLHLVDLLFTGHIQVIRGEQLGKFRGRQQEELLRYIILQKSSINGDGNICDQTMMGFLKGVCPIYFSSPDYG